LLCELEIGSMRCQHIKSVGGNYASPKKMTNCCVA
jgi:hypothetical protein